MSQTNGNKRTSRVVVAMSGGIDSSVAACLLADQGYEVVGMTMRLFDYAPGIEVKNTACCSIDMVDDAHRVCDGIGAAHYTIDLRKPFGGAVQQNFIHEYLAGRTPNPCVQCNIYVKWQSLWQKSREMLHCDSRWDGLQHKTILTTPSAPCRTFWNGCGN